MKTKLHYVFLLYALFFLSCSKEETKSSSDTFIKAVVTDSETVSLACFEISDKYIIAIGRSVDNTSQGWMVKMSSDGEVLWQKKIPIENRVLWNAIPLKAGGFLTIGYDVDFGSLLNFCTYDNDGNLLTVIPFNIAGNAIGYQPGETIPLSNGNFAITYSDNVIGEAFLRIVNSSFAAISTKKFVSNDPQHFGCFLRGIQQTTDSSLSLTASTFTNWQVNIRYNSMIINTTLNGTEISRSVLEDSVFSETANCLGLTSNGLLSVTSTMIGFNSGNGIFISPFSNSNSQLISGRINLIHYDLLGNFISRKQDLSHPGNGILLSAKKCRDGGLILCGTAAINNSQSVASNSKMYLVKVDANFNIVWSKVIDTVFQSYGTDAIELSNGGYCLVGYQRTFNSKFNMIVIKTDANGNI